MRSSEQASRIHMTEEELLFMQAYKKGKGRVKAVRSAILKFFNTSSLILCFSILSWNS